MTPLRTACRCLIALLILHSAAHAQAKPTRGPSSFLIDSSRPFVYLRFERAGPGAAGDEPIPRIWFHLVNNCAVPVVIRTFGAEHGHSFDKASPFTRRGNAEEEIGVMDDVVPNPEPRVRFSAVDAEGNVSEFPPKVEDQGEMPIGYGDIDVSSIETIPPGGAVFFSVPLNHLSKSWHMEIPFTFELPDARLGRAVSISNGIRMVLEFSLWDLPSDKQAEVERVIQEERKRQSGVTR
ncbi:MAG TPA: hypothetical protein VEJ46_15415 [Candidatus Acidoferrum sp.]|nr:hypothetical protein [Candidatus Acidoferrum sp.]